MYATGICLEKETLLSFRMYSVKTVDDCCSFAVVGFLRKNNLTSLLNILSFANHDDNTSARKVSPLRKTNRNKLQKTFKTRLIFHI